MKQGRVDRPVRAGRRGVCAITGHPPTPSIERLMDDQLQPLSEIARGRYSDAFLAAVDAALALHPRDRPQSAAEFWTLLSCRQPLQGLDLVRAVHGMDIPPVADIERPAAATPADAAPAALAPPVAPVAPEEAVPEPAPPEAAAPAEPEARDERPRTSCRRRSRPPHPPGRLRVQCRARRSGAAADGRSPRRRQRFSWSRLIAGGYQRIGDPILVAPVPPPSLATLPAPSVPPTSRRTCAARAAFAPACNAPGPRAAAGPARRTAAESAGPAVCGRACPASAACSAGPKDGDACLRRAPAVVAGKKRGQRSAHGAHPGAEPGGRTTGAVGRGTVGAERGPCYAHDSKTSTNCMDILRTASLGPLDAGEAASCKRGVNDGHNFRSLLAESRVHVRRPAARWTAWPRCAALRRPPVSAGASCRSSKPLRRPPTTWSCRRRRQQACFAKVGRNKRARGARSHARCRQRPANRGHAACCDDRVTERMSANLRHDRDPALPERRTWRKARYLLTGTMARVSARAKRAVPCASTSR